MPLQASDAPSTRQRVLSAAIELFGEVGYYGASLREIAARVGISHPAVLHYFPTKIALLQEVLRMRDAEDSELLKSDLDAGSSLLDATISVVERNTGRRAVVELYAALSAEATATDHPAHEFFVERYTRVIGTLTADLEERARLGELREGIDPAWAARSIVALMDGLQLQWLLLRDEGRDEMAADVRRHLGLIFVGSTGENLVG